MRDKVLVPGIPVRARVGCTEEERRTAQDILVDIELRCDLARAAQSDAIEHTIDYVGARDVVESVASARPYALIETIADRVASRLLASFPAETAVVRVRKPSALAEFGVSWAGVEIERSRNA